MAGSRSGSRSTHGYADDVAPHVPEDIKADDTPAAAEEQHPDLDLNSGSDSDGAEQDLLGDTSVLVHRVDPGQASGGILHFTERSPAGDDEDVPDHEDDGSSFTSDDAHLSKPRGGSPAVSGHVIPSQSGGSGQVVRSGESWIQVISDGSVDARSHCQSVITLSSVEEELLPPAQERLDRVECPPHSFHEPLPARLTDADARGRRRWNHLLDTTRDAPVSNSRARSPDNRPPRPRDTGPVTLSAEARNLARLQYKAATEAAGRPLTGAESHLPRNIREFLSYSQGLREPNIPPDSLPDNHWNPCPNCNQSGHVLYLCPQ